MRTKNAEVSRNQTRNLSKVYCTALITCGLAVGTASAGEPASISPDGMIVKPYIFIPFISSTYTVDKGAPTEDGGCEYKINRSFEQEDIPEGYIYKVIERQINHRTCERLVEEGLVDAEWNAERVRKLFELNKRNTEMRLNNSSSSDQGKLGTYHLFRKLRENYGRTTFSGRNVHCK